MGSKPGKYTQGDINKICRGAAKAGAPMVVLDLGGGVSVTIPFNQNQPALANDLDRELQEFEQRHGQA
jgi:hypothetical protein